jgi:hypothetical protein
MLIGGARKILPLRFPAGERNPPRDAEGLPVRVLVAVPTLARGMKHPLIAMGELRNRMCRLFRRDAFEHRVGRGAWIRTMILGSKVPGPTVGRHPSRMCYASKPTKSTLTPWSAKIFAIFSWFSREIVFLEQSASLARVMPHHVSSEKSWASSSRATCPRLPSAIPHRRIGRSRPGVRDPAGRTPPRTSDPWDSDGSPCTTCRAR